MRWKLFWSKQSNQKEDKKQTFGFKTPHYPSAMKELKAFEEDLIEMIHKVEMKDVQNPLQKQIREDINKIKK